MRFPIDWRDEHAVNQAFRYATRSGIGRVFGSLPIGWYQIHQCAALDELEKRARQATGASPGVEVPVTVRLSAGRFLARSVNGPWYPCGSPRDIFDAADRTART